MKKIPEHIKHIYKLALTMKVPLRKGLYAGVNHKYNRSMKAANIINYYLTQKGQNCKGHK